MFSFFTGPPHPDRDVQFRYIQAMQRKFVEIGIPIISIDTKSKELIGDFKHAGARWVRQPDEVNAHDFRQDADDAGGSNGYRRRLWKRSLQHWANDSGLIVTVCHYPTGASKWNPIEHRLFSQISNNWAGIPLKSLDVMVSLIRGTKTKTGLRVTADINRKRYQTAKVSDRQMRELDVRPHEICPNWNYSIYPQI